MVNIKSGELLDNRHKGPNAALEEVLNDDTPIDETENPKDDPSAPGHIDDTGNEESTEEDEAILADDEELDEETGEPKKKVVTPAPTQESNDTEKRLAEQRREATILNARNNKLTESLSKMNEVNEPTDVELAKLVQAEGGEWEELSAFDKARFKKEVINDRKLAVVNEAVNGVKDIDAWASSVDEYLTNNEIKQTNKSLIGKEGSFRDFAMKASHRGVSMDVLVPAFLHDQPAEKPIHRGSLMLTNTGGERIEKKDNGKDADFAANLRKSNPREYQRALKAGKINIEI